MRVLLTCAMILVVTSAAVAQNRFYENPKFDSIATTHKVIAVLPFKATVKLRPKQMKEITPEQLQELQKNEGMGIQEAMYSWFLTRQQRGTLTVDVQNPSSTNAMLNRQGVSVKNLDEYTPEELAKMLNVDAVIMGTFQTSKPMSEGASIVLGTLFGFFGATNQAVLNMYIHNSGDGETLCNYNRSISGAIGTSSSDLVNKLMRKASRKIAYTK